MNSAAADTAPAVANDDDAVTADWTLSLQSAAVDRRDVEAEAIAACRGLPEQPTDLTQATPSHTQPHQVQSMPETKDSRPPTKSTSEMCVAQVLASLSGSSLDPQQQVPTLSSCLASATNKSTRRRQTSAQKTEKRDKRRSKSDNGVSKAASNVNQSAELSTINVSELNGLSVPVNLSSVANVVVSGASVYHNISSAVSSPSSAPRPAAVTSTVMSVRAADSSKHSFYRPMKQASEFNITYDETKKRYVQTVFFKKSNDRRKSLGFPGYWSDADNTSCHRSLPMLAAVKDSAETKENIDVSAPSPLFAGGEPTGDLSSMEIVTQCCLGQSETKAAEEHIQSSASQPSLAVNTGGQPRKSRSNSQPSGKVSTDREAVPSATNSNTAEVRSADEDDEPLASLLSVSQQRRRAKKNSVKVEKDSGDLKKNAAKGRAAKKSEKIQSRTSPGKSNDIACPTLGSVKPNATGKERGRRKTDKPAEAMKENVSVRKSQTTKNKTNSPCKMPSGNGNVSASPVKRKRRSSSLDVETEQSAKSVVRLPDINCFLTGPVQNGEERATVETIAVTESCADKCISETTDSSLQQNSSVSTDANSSTVPLISEGTTNCSSPAGSIIPPLTSTSSSDCQVSPAVIIPQSSHSVENCVSVSPATPLLGQYLLLTTHEVEWYTILVVSVCLSDDNF